MLNAEKLCVGIIGAGQMGSGLALATARVPNTFVRLCETSEKQADKCKSFLDGWILKESKKKPLPRDLRERIQLIKDLESLKECDLVVECITEQFDLKQGLLQRLGKALAPDTVLATNTSSLSITQLASAFARPSHVLGLHFFNPVPVMQLVEVIPALQTLPNTLEIGLAFAKRIGKTSVIVQDRPCFLVNRVLIVLINEAVHALAEGVGTPEDIDVTFQLGMSHPMGPLRLADFVGLDVCLATLKSLHSGLGDCKYRPSPLLLRYVDAGWLGRKSGRGFYSYAT